MEIDALAWYQCDHLRAPQKLTDQTGEVVWSAQYKAWGGIKEERSSSALQQGIANPLGFQGQHRDHETGLHFKRYRYYGPEVGRFFSWDPIAYAGGLNFYQYGPNAIGWTDPLGLASDDTPRPGPYAVESIPACLGRPTAEEQRQVNALMEKHRCHTCGTMEPGTKSGNAIAGHQPAQALDEPKEFSPHGNKYKDRQGGQVLQEILRRRNEQ